MTVPPLPSSSQDPSAASPVPACALWPVFSSSFPPWLWFCNVILEASRLARWGRLPSGLYCTDSDSELDPNLAGESAHRGCDAAEAKPHNIIGGGPQTLRVLPNRLSKYFWAMLGSLWYVHLMEGLPYNHCYNRIKHVL